MAASRPKALAMAPSSCKRTIARLRLTLPPGRYQRDTKPLGCCRRVYAYHPIVWIFYRIFRTFRLTIADDAGIKEAVLGSPSLEEGQAKKPPWDGALLTDEGAWSLHLVQAGWMPGVSIATVARRLGNGFAEGVQGCARSAAFLSQDGAGSSVRYWGWPKFKHAVRPVCTVSGLYHAVGVRVNG